jgi:hypothetical protein
MDIPRSLFEEKLEHMKESKGVKNDTDLTAADLKELVGQYKEVYLTAKGEPFPSGTRKSACSSIHPSSVNQQRLYETSLLIDTEAVFLVQTPRSSLS